MNKPLVSKPKDLLGNLLFGAPWECLATYFIGLFPITKKGNSYIFVGMNYVTKWVEASSVPHQTVVVISKVLLHEVITRYGCPLILHSD